MNILIHKKKKTLEVWEGETLLHQFPIGIGKAEVGHKEVEGDMRTPEGDYFVCVKNPKSKFHLSLGLNYPNNKDAAEGLNRGHISQAEYDAIVLANNTTLRPPWKTKLGGEVFIHGELEVKDWSEGCVRLFNKDVELLYHLIPVGTPVSIKP